MSTEDTNLQQALSKINGTIFQPAVGFTKEALQTTIVKQNNTIIELLLALHTKVDRLQKHESSTQIENAISDLTAKVANLKISPSTDDKPVVKATPKHFLVWEDPRKQVEAYREQYKKIHGG